MRVNIFWHNHLLGTCDLQLEDEGMGVYSGEFSPVEDYRALVSRLPGELGADGEINFRNHLHVETLAGDAIGGQAFLMEASFKAEPIFMFEAFDFTTPLSVKFPDEFA